MLNSRTYEYNFEIETILQQFIAIIDNATVMRYDVDSETKERQLKEVIKPSYMFGTKQRIIFDLVNKAHNYQLPIIAVNLEGISMVKDRQAAKHIPISTISKDLITSYDRPTPIEIKVTVNVLAKYMTDLYQIYGKIASQFQTYVPFSWFVPSSINGNYIELRNKIEWDGDVNFDIRTEAKATDEDKFTAKMGFTIQGWIFPNMNKCSDGIIYDIGTTVVPNEDTLSRIYDEISIFRPLVYSVIKGKEWQYYNNPREIASAHPLITSLAYTQIISAKQVYFVMDESRANRFRISANSEITINGYNFKDAKVLLVPNKTYQRDINKMESITYNCDLHPLPGTLDKKDSHISGYALNIVKQSDNSITVNFTGLDKLEGEYDLAVVSDVDYDLLSARKGFTLKTY